MSNETLQIVIVVGAVIVVIALIGWLVFLAARLVLVFTAFVDELSPILMILMFILFPPALIVYLAGLAFRMFGIEDQLSARSMNRRLREDQPEEDRRKALGYEK